MRTSPQFFTFLLLCWGGQSLWVGSLLAQTPLTAGEFPGRSGNAVAGIQRGTGAISGLISDGGMSSSARIPGAKQMAPEKLRELMRPNFSFRTQWYTSSDAVQLDAHRVGMTVPTYPIFGPPPPIVSLGFESTHIEAPSFLELPSVLYEGSVNVAWMRRWNDRWMVRSMIGVAQATDSHNNSRDAWQFRGGAFAIFSPNPRWTWTFGALALGRNDLPVVPAVGAIYQPNPGLRYDLLFPRPRVSMLLVDGGARQQWGYLGAAFGGNTWAYEQTTGADDQLTYRDWQFLLGWESTPRQEPGVPFTRGRKMNVEVGYVFGRKFEFESQRADVKLSDSAVLRATFSF